ncbi:MAG: tRNA (adenosine(37)-N6)-threonylcarbamoyltransferase complex dimerization subunit type 1 TsaB, partial [Proteobacteria bacterium]|nr:tRNA (adenosine(37)-N6)-threonylcarbamoyltransferase complex dimerization subunit type 1 TsaB [Pseudomonadota bacterium]
MKILAIETATEACSAALSIDDDCQYRYEIAPRKHTELILPMVNELLLEANCKVGELDVIAFGQGPGAFTGVRIAIGVIQGLAFAHDIPVVPVSSLAALAQQFVNEHEQVATAFDARIQEVYWGLYKKDDNGLMRLMTKEHVCSPENAAIINEGKWFGAGSGWKTYSEQLNANFNDNLSGFNDSVFPCAKEVIELARPIYAAGNAIPVEQAMPV